MSKSLITRAPRFAAGIVLVAALAATPMSAQAADTNATGTLTGGSLTNTAPTIAPFSTALTGVNQTVETDLGGWDVTDATGSNDGYNVTVSATAPTVGGQAADAGTDGSLTLTAPTATADAANPASTGPVSQGSLELGTTGGTIQAAAAGTGQGKWDVAAAPDGLSVVIPGDASAGAYSSTLTFTTAVPVVE
jgi:hypothetical protein